MPGPMWMRPLSAERSIGGLLERGEGGQAVEREIQFRGGSLRAEMLHLDDEAWRQVNRVEKAEQSASRVGAGDDAFRGDFFAACERNANDGAIFYQDFLYVGIGANFGACLFRRCRHRCSERAHSSARHRGIADRIRIGGGAKKQERR